jgi:hypothetical protein
MIDVVCFCGCSYSFLGDAGACPDCGEVASMPSTGSSDHTEHEPLDPPRVDLAEDDLAA